MNSEEDDRTEFLDLILSVKVVPDVDAQGKQHVQRQCEVGA